MGRIPDACPIHRRAVLAVRGGELHGDAGPALIDHHPVLGGHLEHDGCGRRVLVVLDRTTGKGRRAVEVGHLGPGSGPAVQREHGSNRGGRARMEPDGDVFQRISFVMVARRERLGKVE